MPSAEWIFEHAAPGWLLALALLAASLTAIWSAWKFLPRSLAGVVPVAFRVLFLALLFWTLLLPAKKSAVTEIVKPRFIVLLDTSASMAQTTDETPAYSNRWEAAKAILRSDGFKKISGECIVEVYPFAGDLQTPLTGEQASALQPEGNSSHISLALARLFDRMRGQTIAGVLILTDGIDTREKKDAWASAAWGAPLYVAQLEKPGKIELAPDMRVDAIDTPRRAVVGWDTQMTVSIAGQGGDGVPFPVILFRNGEEIAKTAVQIPAEGGSKDVQFKLPHEKIGAETYLVRIPFLPDEVQTNDNEMAVSVDVLDAKNRVLFLEDVPRFESKHFSRALFANKDVTPLAFFQMPSKKNQGAKEWIAYGDTQGLSFDLTPEQLQLNKIIILGDFDSTALTDEHCRTLLDFVENGGSLILLGGQKMWGQNGIAKTALAKLLPFSRTPAPALEGKFPVEWTAEGRAHPALANNKEMPQELPPVLSVFAGAQLSGGAFAIAEAKTEQGEAPLLVSRIYGQGKVLAVLTDSLWRWQMQPGADKPYPKFWRQIIQWMSPAEAELDKYHLELSTDAGTISVGDFAILQARIALPPGETRKNWRVLCAVETPSGRSVPLAMQPRTIQTSTGAELPGYTAEFSPEEEGNYKATAEVEIDGRKIQSAACLFTARATSKETVLMPINEKVLRALARSSGGRYGNEEEISKSLLGLSISERRERRLDYRSLWHSPFLLAALIALLAAEWVWRKSKNLA